MSNRVALALACGLALSVSAAPAMAELFGAIAFSPSTGQYGWAKNQSVDTSASDEAIAGCGVGDCEAVVTFANCAARFLLIPASLASMYTARRVEFSSISL